MEELRQLFYVNFKIDFDFEMYEIAGKDLLSSGILMLAMVRVRDCCENPFCPR